MSLFNTDIYIKTYTVSQLNEEIKLLFSEVYPYPIYVQGEISGFDKRKSTKHIYFELCEKQKDSDDVLAKISCVIFQSDALYIFEKLKQCENSFSLQDGIEVRFVAKLDFYTASGKCELIIKDIDPTYTLGKIAQNRQRIIEELKKTGLLDKNKKLHIPDVPLRIGLLTSYNSAAYNDFVQELLKSEYGFKINLYNIFVQGKELEGTLTSGVNYFNTLNNIDVIVIIRGGGSRADLSWFDNKNIAVCIANSKYPVITGIGHETDVSVVDLVANVYLKTPTAVANFLIQKVKIFNDKLESNFQEIKDLSLQKIQDKTEELKNITDSIANDAVNFLKFKSELVKSMSSSFNKDAISFIAKQRQKIHRNIERISDRVRYIIKNQYYGIEILSNAISLQKLNRILQSKKEQLEINVKNFIKYSERYLLNLKKELKMLDEKNNYLNPANILKRGFSITKDNTGKTIKSIKQVKVDECLNTIVYDGRILSKVLLTNTGEENERK